MSEMGKEIECLEDIGESKVSFQQMVAVKTLMRVAAILLKHSHNSNHAKAQLECALLLLESIPSCIALELKIQAFSILSQCYHLAGATVSQKQVLNNGFELTAPSAERLAWLDTFSATSNFAVRCNDDVAFGSDGRSMSFFYCRVEASEQIKAYTLYGDVFVLGSGFRPGLIIVVDEMRTFTKQTTIPEVRRFADELAQLADEAKLYGEKRCDFIVIGRLDINSAAEIYRVSCEEIEDHGAMEYDVFVSHKVGETPGPSSMCEASGSGAPFMQNCLDWPHMIDHLKKLRENKERDNDDERLMEYVRDVIAEARTWDYYTDGTLLIVELCKGQEAKFRTAKPNDARNSFSGYGKLEHTEKRPLFRKKDEEEAAERANRKRLKEMEEKEAAERADMAERADRKRPKRKAKRRARKAKTKRLN